MISRRQFVTGAATGLAGLRAISAGAAPLGLPIGCQVYPVRDALLKDFDGTLRELSAAGFKTIEMCSPPGYNWTPLVDIKAGEMRKRIQAAGLRCESCHYTMRELRENLSERIDFAKELGLKQMILSSFSVKPGSPMSDWVRVAGELNKFSEQMKKDGIQGGFHNHDGEFKEIDGVLIYDKLLSELDPQLVKMQFQVIVVRLGFNAPGIFQKHPGRFISLHLQDWSPSEKKMVPIGQGEVDWKSLFGTARKAGVKNYFVEMDLAQMKASMPYLEGLQT